MLKCKRCNGPVMSQYGEASCLHCGWQPVEIDFKIIKELMRERNNFNGGKGEGRHPKKMVGAI